MQNCQFEIVLIHRVDLELRHVTEIDTGYSTNNSKLKILTRNSKLDKNKHSLQQRLNYLNYKATRTSAPQNSTFENWYTQFDWHIQTGYLKKKNISIKSFVWLQLLGGIFNLIHIFFISR